MSLQLKFCHSVGSDCKSFLFKDTTGAYDVTTNPTGYGAPNPLISAFDDPGKAELIITKPDNSKVTFTLSDFPTTNEEITYLVTASSLGYATGNIADGMYTMQYKLTSNDITPVIYKTSTTFLYTCDLNCKIKKILADSVKFQMNCDDCNNGINENIKKLGMIVTLFEGLCAMGGCPTPINKINEALENLQTLVSEYDTEDCNCG